MQGPHHITIGTASSSGRSVDSRKPQAAHPLKRFTVIGGAMRCLVVAENLRRDLQDSCESDHIWRSLIRNHSSTSSAIEWRIPTFGNT